jgi:NADPH-dependent F420 reductase
MARPAQPGPLIRTRRLSRTCPHLSGPARPAALALACHGAQPGPGCAGRPWGIWQDRHMAAEQSSEFDPAEAAASATIGVLGGTGDQGRGLARRLGLAGNKVIIGSRDQARAQRAAAELGLPHVTGAANEDAARAADVVIAAIPWEGHKDLLSQLADALTGKIVIDCVNPIGFDAKGAYALPVPEGSAAEQAAGVLPGSTVVGAFHHVSAVLLLDPDVEWVDLDVLVTGDNRRATDLVEALASRIPGARGVYAGRLRNCGQVEALTANLVSVNRRYKAHSGLRVTDV